MQSLRHSLEQTARENVVYVNSDQTEFMHFKYDRIIYTLLIDQFTYLGSNISSTERDVSIHIEKAWTAIDRLSIIWKSDRFDRIKQDFFSNCCSVSFIVGINSIVSFIVGINSIVSNETSGKKKLKDNYTRMLHAFLNQLWKQHHKTAVVWPLVSHLTNHPFKRNKTYWALLEK